MRVLVVPVGSHGDVHPLVGIARALKGRGHEVSVASNGHFEGLIRGAGLEYVGLGTDEEFRKAIDNPDLWHPMKGFRTVMERGVFPFMERTHELITKHYSPDDTVIVAAAIAFGARVAQETHGFRLVTTQLQPSPIRTVHEHPAFKGMWMPQATPRAIKRAVWSLADWMVVDRVAAGPVNEFRARFGLKPVRHLLDQWWMSPDRVLGLFPEWFAPVQPDWPSQLRLTGFPLFDEAGITPLDAGLAEFLDRNPGAVAFTPGSAHVHAEEFFAESVRACEVLGRPGLLLTRHGGQIPGRLPPAVRHVPYAPFSELLPRCAALVHHGGIGTTAQALRAGCPQVIVPWSHDQPDNAARVKRLGVGAEIAVERYRAKRVAGVLSELVGSAEVARRCREVAGRFEGVDALGAACGEIERLEKRGHSCSVSTL